MSRGDRRRRRHEPKEEALRHLRNTLRGGGDSGEGQLVSLQNLARFCSHPPHLTTEMCFISRAKLHLYEVF